MVQEKQFRSDLYYRLNVFPIKIPPLRERVDDIPKLTRYFVSKYANKMDKQIETISTSSMKLLQRWSWPGNVRELENVIERAVILTAGEVLNVPEAEFQLPASEALTTGDLTLHSTEREHILKVLRETEGVLSGPQGAAMRLGLKRTTLQSRMKKLGITREHYA
jgi:formate hydrogenlyase transcriptional activator